MGIIHKLINRMLLIYWFYKAIIHFYNWYKGMKWHKNVYIKLIFNYESF